MTLDDAIAKVIEGFDRGVFVRDTTYDYESGWATEAVPYIQALAVLGEHTGALKEKNRK